MKVIEIIQSLGKINFLIFSPRLNRVVYTKLDIYVFEYDITHVTHICCQISAFLDSIGCLAKLKAASTTINCLRSGPFLHSDIHKYFTGEKDVFSNKEEFCR